MMKERDSYLLSEQENSSNIRGTDGIFRVPLALWRANPNAFIPQFIPIGPVHGFHNSYGYDPIIRKMKFYFFRNFASTEVELNKIVRLVIGCEKRATEFYKIDIRMGRAEFLESLILDCCFVVMYILSSVVPLFQDFEMSSFSWRFNDAIFRDMVLFENQLPFFLLQSLYELCAFNNYRSILGEFSFIQLTHKFFMAREGIGYLGKDFRVLHEDKLEVNHFVHFLSYYMNSLDHTRWRVGPSLAIWPPTATELYDYGISFEKKSHYSQKMFDERAGILRLPHIIINETFESMIRNIIAFEHCHRKRQVVSNFAIFMRFLLNSDNDVILLIKEGIIHNHLESTKGVTKLFHDLCENVVVETNLYNYECKRMREYGKHRRHRWMASLKRDYFNTPWALISFIAAVVLLLLTLMQTVVAVLSMPK
ncbi:UPF0481 protein At3g47200-like [Momordica charantia]|uniref:UPF0481 protein At3g47200-like n=1 Tax=Momordica charantia TaxID=3673 RepID=A0A6J1BR42_MOMCH|nr:UPF0481 protein At3g47200-like [Momordica charantia]XP_022132034.1 UPF0481 protein At3g47200-like [Momordica charantia]XP_022132035.1 UPF0481 protein At3g47200-like [Momordica charantia]XP_022132036.1 UPF0481 protein At3g47200-like [Momordica charantia]